MAEKMLSEKLGEVEYDGLIAGVNPKKRVGPGVIAGPEAETTFVRGTVFAKSAKDGKLHILGTEASGGDTLTADCILIEDNIPVYVGFLDDFHSNRWQQHRIVCRKYAVYG